jgi:hypothetical protein
LDGGLVSIGPPAARALSFSAIASAGLAVREVGWHELSAAGGRYDRIAW